VNDLATVFHEYALDWRPDRMDFLFDGKVFHSFKNLKTGSDAWPFDQRFHLLLNIAVGGNWGGKMGVDETIWPQRMEVDYVRVYRF
jgi:beta-glucanase (GH16 family)